MTDNYTEYLKPARERSRNNKDKRHERRDHPLHKPYKRERNTYRYLPQGTEEDKSEYE